MSTRVDVEEIESTRSEKFLAVVLTAFLLIGSIWFYVQAEDWFDGRDRHSVVIEEPHDDSWEDLAAADKRVMREQSDVDAARAALDVAIAKGAGVDQAQAAYTKEQAELRAALDAADAAQQKAEKQEKADEEKYREQYGPISDGRQWLIAGIRFGFIAGWVLGSLWLLGQLRSRQSRFLPLGFAAIAAGVITALVFAVDYILEYIDPLDFGPIVLSAIGAAATIAAFVVLQKYLARRIPGRRVRKGECPFCGFPVREDALTAGRDHCEGCGRDVVGACSSCDQPRRVGSPHCSACGVA